MEFTGEQCVIGSTTSRIEEDHLARYEFVKKYVAGKTVLDLACGTGYGTRMIRNFSGKPTYGIDISTEAITHAKKTYATDGLEFIHGDVTKLPFTDSFFDTIVSFETIEHLDANGRNLFLNELYRVLKPDGTLILSTPNRRITSPLSRKPLNKYHIIEYSISEILKVMQEHRFKTTAVLGQRMVHICIVPFLVRKCIGLMQLIIGKNYSLYHIANGPGVSKVDSLHTPRYIILINKK